jgi:hypothetical protein
MRTLRLILCLSLLVFTVLPLHAQWGGSINATGGIGWIPNRFDDEEEEDLLHMLLQGSASLNYKSPTLRWNSTLGANFEYRSFDQDRIDLSNIKDVSDIGMKTAFKTNMDRPLNFQFHNDAVWTPSRRLQVEPWLTYTFNYHDAFNYVFRGNYHGKDNKETCSVELMQELAHRVSAGVRARRELGSPRLVLAGELSGFYNYQEKLTEWAETDDLSEEALDRLSNRYRITPFSNAFNLYSVLRLQDSVLTGKVRLMLEPGVRLAVNRVVDRNSGATLDTIIGEEEIWRDSVSLRETFHFLTLRTEPYLVADLAYSKLRVSANYALQVYARRLTDSLHRTGLGEPRFYPVGNGSVAWLFSDHHRVTLGNELSVSHPGYLQMCWYVRPGDYPNQRIVGNPQLRSTRTQRYYFNYRFDYGRFHSATELFYRRVIGEVERTWSNETIDGMEYKVFTWVNAADSRAMGGSQRFSWTGRILLAHLQLDYTGNRRQMRESGEVKESFDWRLSGDFTWKMGRGWEMGADAVYTSKVRTFYSLFGEYCALSARVQKSFKNGLTLYLRGRDLLDKEITHQYLSADGKEGWLEKIRLNRRLVLLGLSWKF